MNEDAQAVTDAIRSEVGDGLRAVGTYDCDGYEVLYARSDVAPKLTDDYLERMQDDMVLRNIDAENLENIFDTGELRCTAYRFAEVTIFHYGYDDTAGLVVSTDSETDFRLSEFERLCEGVR